MGPYTDANIQKLEMVQRRAAKEVCDEQARKHLWCEWHASETGLAKHCMRKDVRLFMMFKIDGKCVAISKEPRLQQAWRKTTRTDFDIMNLNYLTELKSYQWNCFKVLRHLLYHNLQNVKMLVNGRSRKLQSIDTLAIVSDHYQR